MSTSPRVLVVEDEPADADLMLLALRRGGLDPSHAVVDSADGLRAALGDGAWDAVLCDHALPGFGALAALGLVRAHDPDLPFVVVSGTIGEEAAVELMRAGASDYVLKSSLARLAPAVRRELQQAADRRRKRAAERDAAQLAAIVASTDDAIVSESLNLVITTWNPGAERLFGWAAAEVIGRPMTVLIPDHMRAEFVARTGQVRATGRAGHYETERLRKDGSTVQVAVTLSPIRGADGQVTGFSWIARDVTARKRAEADLLLRDRAIQAATQGLTITDPGRPDNPLVYVSPGFTHITGYAPDEAIGRNCRFLQGKDTDREVVRRVREAVRAGEPITVELLNYRKDGTPFWKELSITPVRDDAGRVTHFVGVQSDITPRRQLEEQFRQARKMEAVGQLAGGIAHDFNNLLTVINGYAELLQSAVPAGDVREGLATIRDAGARAAQLTGQLLAFSRKSIVAPRMLDLGEVVAQTARILTRLIGEHIECVTELVAGPERVRADPTQVEQVLLNLAVNARDAMPDGGRLTVRTDAVSVTAGQVPGLAPGRYARLTVTDTGCGMTPEVQARIFEPFFTTKEVGKGTGLGLATVYGIVQQAGGGAVVRSAVGVGTTFEVLFPAVPADVPAPSSRELRVSPRGSETILLVEDDPLVRELTVLVLRSLGYVVLTAATGAQALRLADEHTGRVHLLLTDVVMPGLSGRETAAALVSRWPGLRVLYVSGYNEDAVLQRGVRDGTDAFLQKPFTPAALCLKVREVLNAPRA